MIAISIYLFAILALTLFNNARENGVPDMVSDLYYNGEGKWFSVMMSIEAVGISTMLILQESALWLLAATGGIGLLAVGITPAYLHCDRCHWFHKLGAYTAAVGCLGWCLLANPLPTTYICILYIGHLIGSGRYKPWYVAEICAFADIFITYWANSSILQ